MIIWSVIAFCLSLLSLLPYFSLNFFFVAEFFIIPTDASTLPAELQRLLNTVRELDERSQCNCFICCSILLCLFLFLFVFKIFLCRNQEIL